MNKIKTISKGTLLWFTITVAFLSICSLDSIIDKGFVWFFNMIVINTIFIVICTFTINEKEFMSLSGYNWFDKKLNIED